MSNEVGRGRGKGRAMSSTDTRLLSLLVSRQEHRLLYLGGGYRERHE